VKQAYYDADKDLLLVTLVPGDKSAVKTSTQFLVNQLDRSKVYTVSKNGKSLGYMKKGVIHPQKGAKSLEARGEGNLAISTDLSRTYTFVIQAEK